MASLGQAKTLGGVGSILVLLGAVPSVGFVLAIAGFIMILVAVKNVSETINQPKIFNDMIIAVVTAIVGLVVFGLVVVAAISSFINIGALGTTTTPGTVPAGVISGVVLLAVGLFLLWIFYL